MPGGNGHDENPYWPFLQASDVQNLMHALRGVDRSIQSLDRTIQSFIRQSVQSTSTRELEMIIERLERIESALTNKGKGTL